MTIVVAYDPTLTRFRAALDDMYGNRLERVVLFGSRARAEGRSDSDYDIAVFLHTMPDRWAELTRLADVRTEFLDETGAFFDAKPYLVAALSDRTPLMHEIRKDGVIL
jgi:predicted nucleotidyltransferase